MQIRTDALGDDGFFDSRYTCDADNSSPELRWQDPPQGTSSFALIAEDPDARGGLFTHWLIYHIPALLHHLPAGIPPQETLPNGIRQGVNSAGKLGYTGPCPPVGDTPHHYVFRIYALAEMPSLPSRLNREQFLAAVEPYILGTAELKGQHQRRSYKKAG